MEELSQVAGEEENLKQEFSESVPTSEVQDQQQVDKTSDIEEVDSDMEHSNASNDFQIVDSQRVIDHPASAGFRYRRSSR